MTAPLLVVEELTFRYRRASEPALAGVSLQLEPGQVLLVAGPSGCGKSTLIRAINGLIPHAYRGDYSGSVTIAGETIATTTLRAVSRHVGTVLQDPDRQIVGATVEAELAFGPENLGLPREEIRQRLREVSERAGVVELLGRETAALSGGERQLAAVAGILMMHPRLLVVDEPLANLDPATAQRLMALLRRIADEGGAVVMVEHRVEEALELRPDLALALDAGRVGYLGPVDGFLRQADPSMVKLPFEVILDHVGATRATAAGASAPAASEGPVRETTDADGAAPRLEFRGVHAGYEARAVLHDISARLGARESVAVLGPNGSGKTTLFKTAMGLLQPTGGEILVDGASTRGRSVADLARIFGYVFQSPSQMLFAQTVRQELLFGPRNLGIPAADYDSLVAEVLRQVALDGLEGIQERPPLTLSFGQQKRLAIAIALALRPRTLILDEPSAGQDHRSARTFMGAIRELGSIDGLYFVTHDADLALTQAARILLLREGRIVADGPPAQVVRDLDRWRACNLRETSLMRANLRWGDGEHFLDAEALARKVARGTGAAPAQASEGGSSGQA
jgi:energy-coupling factor transporter ATP-binding protein EcfA2